VCVHYRKKLLDLATRMKFSGSIVEGNLKQHTQNIHKVKVVPILN
jgi:hypothetical protein